MRARHLYGTALVCLLLTTAIVPSFALGVASSPWSLPWKTNGGGAAVTEIGLAALPDGGVVAVWISGAYGSKTLYYSERLPGAGWQPSAVIQLGTDLTDLSFAVNGQGQGALVWTQSTAYLQTYGSFYNQSTGFSAPALLNNYTYYAAYTPTVAISDAGTAAALWFEDDGTNVSAFVARGNARTGTWLPAEVIESMATLAYPERSGIAVDGNGTTHAIWRQNGGAGYRVFTNRYTPGAGWATAKTLDNGSGGSLENLRVAALPDGRAIAFWIQQEWNTGALPLVSTFDSTGGWDAAPRHLPTAAGPSAGFARLACGGTDTCLLSWFENVGPHRAIVVTSTVDGGATFAPPQLADATLAGNGFYSDVAVGPAGDGLVVWSQDSEPPAGADTPSAYARAFDPNTGFGTAYRLDRISTQSVDKVEASATAGGGLAAMWMQHDGLNLSAYVSTSWPVDTAPPTIRITAPLNGTVLAEGSAVVTGIADGATNVSVNGVVVSVQADGSFELRTPLALGQNLVGATATDEAGNSAVASVNVTVLDPTSALTSDLQQANQVIGWLLENQSRLDDALFTKDTEIASLHANISVLHATLSAMSVEQSTWVLQVADLRGQVANATANASAAETRAEQAQAAAANASAAAAQTSGRAADSAQASASTALLLAIVALVIAAGAAVLSFVRGGGGGGRGGGGKVSIERQTPKRDFGDRMKAGLDTAGGVTGGEEGIGSQGSDGVLRGPRQSTSVEGSYAPDAGGERADLAVNEEGAPGTRPPKKKPL